MSSWQTSTYDQFVKAFGYDGNEWHPMKLFMAMVKREKGEAFSKKTYDEVLSMNYTDKDKSEMTQGPNDVSVSFLCFLEEFLAYVDNRIIKPGSTEKWPVETAGSELREGVSFITQLSNKPSRYTQDEIYAFMKEAVRTDWFSKFFGLLTKNGINALNAGAEIEFRSGVEIVKALGILDLFSGANTKTTGTRVAGMDFDNASDFYSSLLKLGSQNRNWVSKKCEAFRGNPDAVFNYKVDKNVLRTVFGEALDTAKKASKFWETMPVISSGKPEDLYFREVGKPGKLFMKGSDGKSVEIQPGSEHFKNLKMGTNCYDIGFTASGTEDCTAFFTKCLNGDKIEDCKDFMRTTSYWKNVSKDVENMDPTISAKILYQFGFQTVDSENKELGLTLKMFPQPEEWLASLATNFSAIKEADVKEITGNEKLIGFLRLLVKKINQNPGVINPGYTSGGMTTDGEAFKNTSFGKMGITPKFVIVGKSGPTPEAISRLKDTIMQNRMGYANNLFIPFPMALYGYASTFRGGADQEGGSFVKTLEALSNSHELPQSSSQQLSEIYDALIGTLQAQKRDLDTSDKDVMMEMKKKLQQMEEKLFTANVYLAKFVELVGIHGLDGESGVLTLDNIQKFVDKHNQYFEKTVKTENDFISAVMALANATETETKEKTESKSVVTYPVKLP